MAVPIYLTQAEVGRHLGVTRSAVRNWILRFPDQTPDPAAYYETRIPLWTAEQLPAWEAWLRRNHARRDTEEVST